MKEKIKDLDELIKLSHIVAKPYLVAVWVLSILLFVSICANVYLSTQPTEITFDANENSFSKINQQN